MINLYRGLTAGMLIVSLFILGGTPADLAAQDKKDAKKAKGDDPKEHSVGIGTSDGLTLSGYFYQGVGFAKQQPDAVIMMPAPGNKINEAWINLAESLSKKNFSVLLFDWRGCGLNGPDGMRRRCADFPRQGGILEGGLQLPAAPRPPSYHRGQGPRLEGPSEESGQQSGRYRDFSLMNDLLAARFFLDKYSDSGRCNTNRVWIVSEKDGAYVGMSFIAAEFQRNSIYDPKRNVFDTLGQFKSAGKDYAGLMALSYSTSGQSYPRRPWFIETRCRLPGPMNSSRYCA